MHTAIVEARTFIFVTFTWGQSWRHVTHTDYGQFTQFALVDKTFHRLMIPRVAEIEIDGGEHIRVFRCAYHIPLAFHGVGHGFLRDDVLAIAHGLINLLLAKVGQCT